MPEKKTTTHNAEIVEPPFGMLRVKMPANAALDDDGFVVFVMNTAAGPVRVKAYWNEFECRGKAHALIAAGLTRAEWFPGLPGNQKSRQRVIFDSTGPRLYAGRGGAQKETPPYITVCRYSSSTFAVEVPATPEQCKRLEVFHKQRADRDRTKVESVQKEDHEKQLHEYLLNRKSEEVRRSARSNLELFAFALSIGAKGPGVRYADDVMAEVNTHLDAIGRALLGGRILPAASHYQREGNVVYFPGSTDVEKQECGA